MPNSNGDAALPEFLRGLAALEEGRPYVVEVRSLKVPQRYGNPATECGYFDLADPASVATLCGVVDLHNTRPAELRPAGIYLTVNPLKPELLARAVNRVAKGVPSAGDADVLRRRILPVDLDPVRPSGISASDAELQQAELLCRRICGDLCDRGWPEPLLQMSGNGFQAWYGIDLPADDGGAVERVLKELSERYSGSLVKVDAALGNASRIGKLPTTWARKGDSTAERPHRQSRVVSVPTTLGVVPAELLAPAKPEPPEPPKPTNGKPADGMKFKVGTTGGGRLDVGKWLADRGVGYRTKDRPDGKGRTVYVLDECPFDPEHKDPDSCVMQDGEGKLSAKCLHDSCAGRGWKQFKEKIGPPDAGHYDAPARPAATSSAPVSPPPAPPPPAWNGEPGHAILDDVLGQVRKYVAMPSPEAAVAVALFVGATHAQACWEHATRLVLKSPQKQCGKSRLQEVASEMAHNPLRTSNISTAALVRSITEGDPPVLILDEADSVFAKKRSERSEGAEDLRGILNAGHGRGVPYICWNAQAKERELCPTFAMAVLGGIGDMPDTIEDRAVVITMRRRAPGEIVSPFRVRRARPALHAVRDRLRAWVCAHLEALRDTEPALPVEDRAADVWEPLVAIADLAGGEWPRLARAACVALTAAKTETNTDGDAGEQLLADLRQVFGDSERLSTTEIISLLKGIEESPWAEWHRGEPITVRGLSRLLKPYGVKARQFREGDERARGYFRDDLADAWDRYCTNFGTPSVTRVTRVTDDVTAAAPNSSGVTDDSPVSVTPSVTRPPSGASPGDRTRTDGVTDSVTDDSPVSVTTEPLGTTAVMPVVTRVTRVTDGVPKLGAGTGG